jgi:ComF family protein
MGGAVLEALARRLLPWWQAAADLLFPPRCQVCGRPDAFPLCGPCWLSFPRIRPPVCEVCGRPLRGPPDLRFVCVPCRHRRQGLRVRAFGRYEGPLREAVHALKYKGRLALAQPLGRALAEVVWTDEALGRADVLVPVPLHPRREAQRGFNQSEELARVLARCTGLPVHRALRRVRDTPSQTELGEDERRRNVRGAFEARGCVRGLRVVLVDDVVTTGSTLSECATVLRAAGAAEVCAVAVARAGGD